MASTLLFGGYTHEEADIEVVFGWPVTTLEELEVQHGWVQRAAPMFCTQVREISCPDFSWERISFLLSSWYSAVGFFVFIWETDIFFQRVLVLNQALFSLPCSVSEELHIKVGGTKVSAGDMKWPKEYSIP